MRLMGVAVIHANLFCSVISTAGRNLQTDMPSFYVYLLTNQNNKVMYVGVTNHLVRRVYEHKTKQIQGFTEKYNVNKLVYFEETSDVRAAITREKEIKKWRREKKNSLVVTVNPDWKDLSEGWFEISPCGRDDRNRVAKPNNHKQTLKKLTD